MKHPHDSLWCRPAFLVAFTLTLFLALAACDRPLQPERAEQDMTATAAAPLQTLPVVTLPPANTLPADGSQPPGQGYPAPTPEVAVPSAQETPLTESPPAQAAEPTPATDVIHVVQAGDTLGKIAEQYGVAIEDIALANGLVDIDTLDIGQSLIIPLSGNLPTVAATEAAAGQERIHIVQFGETLYRIGPLYGFTAEELAAYNNLANPDRLDIGQQIRIPPSP